MYLLDTDAVSQVIKRNPSIPFIRKLASTDVEKQFTTTITVGELVYGAYRLGTRGAALLERLEKTLLPNLPILPLCCRSSTPVWRSTGCTRTSRAADWRCRYAHCGHCTRPRLHGSHRQPPALSAGTRFTGSKLARRTILSAVQEEVPYQTLCLAHQDSRSPGRRRRTPCRARR